MTINSPIEIVFSKHFKKTKLIRISKDFIQDYMMGNCIFFIEGKIVSIKVFNSAYAEIQIKDDMSEMLFPVIAFDLTEDLFIRNATILCVGAMHSSWIPDMRCKNNHYEYAIKADLIRIRQN